MKKVIHHLKKRSEEERRHVLNMAVLIVGVILMLLWVYSLGRTVTDDEVKDRIADDFNELAPLESNTSIPESW